MDEATLIHEELRAIARTRHQLHAREAVLLVRAEQLEIWHLFGCATIYEYLDRFCDLHPRTAREYLRVARALGELPAMRAQLDAERIVYSTARELTRIATPETEVEWLRAVVGLSPREIEEEVADRKRGDRPSDAKDPDRMVWLKLRVRSSTRAAFFERCTRYADEHGERPSDDDIIAEVCRPHDDDSDPGLAPYQLAITTCRACAKSHQVAAGREIEITRAMLECAQCDARDVGDLESDAPQRLTSTVTPRIRRQVLMRDRYMCWVPGCRSQRCLDVHHIRPQAEGGSHLPSNLVTLCGGHHRQLHEGKLILHGKAPHDLAFEWRDDPTRTSTRGWRSEADPHGPVGREADDDPRPANDDE